MTGCIQVEIATEFYVNFPRAKSATIPLRGKLRVHSLEGQISVNFPPKPNDPFSLCFIGFPTVQFDVELDGRWSLVTVLHFLCVLVFMHACVRMRACMTACVCACM